MSTQLGRPAKLERCTTLLRWPGQTGVSSNLTPSASRYARRRREMNKSLSWIVVLHDDESSRKKEMVMDKSEIMADDSRNPDMSQQVEDFLEFGKSYKITIEEIDSDDRT